MKRAGPYSVRVVNVNDRGEGHGRGGALTQLGMAKNPETRLPIFHPVWWDGVWGSTVWFSTSSLSSEIFQHLFIVLIIG